jgi:prepilin-type N-terminal cleavage/methylation domain-containing protein
LYLFWTSSKLTKEVIIKILSYILSPLKTNRGFTLAEVMVATAILGLVSVGVVKVISDQSKLNSRSEVGAEMAQVNVKIMNILISPNHCNANFYAKALTNNAVTAVYSCGSQSLGCHGANAVSSIPVVSSGTSETDAFWSQSTTGLTNKIRIKSISYAVPSVSVTTALSNLVYTVTYQTRLDPKTPMQTIIKKFTVPVVVTGSTSIAGCPKSFDSTDVY